MALHLSSSLGALTAVLAIAACGSSSTTSSSSSARVSAGGSTSTSASSTTAGTSAATSSGSSGQLSYEGILLEQGPSLALARTTQTGPVDGIRCGATEQLAYHIHAHLAVFVNGAPSSLPGGIGIPGSTTEQTNQGPVAAGGQCIYWLHTHTSDGVIHIESPTRRIYTLGVFFDEWHQPLTATRIGGAQGKVAAFLNGKLWTRSLRAIPLLPHAVIQVNVGEPAPRLMKVNWPGTGL